MRQLNVHKLVENLNKLCDILIDEFNINCGGCCYVAYEIAKHLDRFNIEYDLCVLNDCPLDLKRVTKEVRSKHHDRGFGSVTGENTCCHYYLVVKGGGPVNRGNPYDGYRVYAVTKINHRNLNWLYRTGCWNSVYKDENNKLIKKIISLHFRQYGKASKARICTYQNDSVSQMQVRC